jgi:glycosyltransferase involved in cell wall biosynthesis
LSVLAVALDMTFPNRNRGGTGVYARSLSNALRQRDDVVVEEISGPTAPGLAGTLDWLVRGASRELARRQARVLHCPSFVVPWGVRCPIVVTVHDAATRHVPRDHPLEWRFYDRAILPRRLLAAARVVTVSSSARADIVREYGLPDERIVVIPNGVDERFLSHGPSPDGVGERPTLLFPGAPIPRKNIKVVLVAMATSRPGLRLSQARLEISGAAADDFSDVVAMVSRLGLQDRVRWLGYIPADEMPDVIAHSSVVVYPSLTEGFGLPVLEAFAVGVPVVSSDRGSLPEIVGDAGLLVNPTDVKALGDAIEAVLTNEELRGRLRDRGAQRVKQYTWERCAEMTCELYRTVISEAT